LRWWCSSLWRGSGRTCRRRPLRRRSEGAGAGMGRRGRLFHGQRRCARSEQRRGPGASARSERKRAPQSRANEAQSRARDSGSGSRHACLDRQGWAAGPVATRRP
jgi:hypothetical protein